MAGKVSDLATPLLDDEGFELVHVEYQREGSGRILRLYIDRPGGVSLDDCVSISRQMGDLLAVHLEIREPYSLEVSSPGSNRPLGKESDFEKFKGFTARIRTTQPVDGQKNFTGILLGISEGIVKLSMNDATVAIPFHCIARGRVVDYNGENKCLSQT